MYNNIISNYSYSCISCNLSICYITSCNCSNTLLTLNVCLISAFPITFSSYAGSSIPFIAASHLQFAWYITEYCFYFYFFFFATSLQVGLVLH